MTTFVFDGRTMQDHYWGIGRYSFNLARALAHAAPQDTFRVLYNPDARNTRFDLSQLTSQHNLGLQPVNARAFSIQEQAMVFDRALWREAALYHSPYYVMPYALPLPIVASLHDQTPLVIRSEMPGAGKRLLYRTLHRIAAGRARRVITISDASRTDLVEQLKIARTKITVIYPGPFTNSSPASLREIERVRAALHLPPAYLLYLGINKPHKNLERLVRAFAPIETDAVLVIAGHWDSRYPQVKEYVAANDLQERILFRHDIVETDVVPLLTGATAFVFPSQHEGFGLPPLEAMGVGTPVACSNVSAMPEVVGDAALLFEPLDTTAITDAMARILNDVNLRATLREKGLVRASKFSWERAAQETLRVYREILAS